MRAVCALGIFVVAVAGMDGRGAWAASTGDTGRKPVAGRSTPTPARTPVRPIPPGAKSPGQATSATAGAGAGNVIYKTNRQWGYGVTGLSAYNRALEGYVTEQGALDYERFYRNITARGAIKAYARSPLPEEATKEERIADNLNKYNVTVLERVIKDLRGVRRTPTGLMGRRGAFDKERYKVAGREVTLDQLQQEGRKLGVPEMLFGYNYAARGGPPVQPTAFEPTTVMARLKGIESAYLDEKTEVRTGKIVTSELLFWYPVDFTGVDPAKEPARFREGIVKYLKAKLPPTHPAVAALAKTPAIEIAPRNDWDWRLNEP